MSVADEDPDAILALLDEEFGEINEPDAVDYTKLNLFELTEAFNEVREALLATGEMHKDLEVQGTIRSGTDEGRELHSKRAALLVEFSRRHEIPPIEN